MAASIQAPKILLGYEDEEITDKYEATVDFATSKIGGKPNWPTSAPPNEILRCSLCNNISILVSQIYAPLDYSTYHRTLYVFACIQPTCWNKSESWKCYRSQVLDSTYTVNTDNIPSSVPQFQPTDWLDSAEDWGSGGEEEEENGNVVFPTPKVDIASSTTDDNATLMKRLTLTTTDNISRDESVSSDLSSEMNDSNANLSPDPGFGARGLFDSVQVATAEIELENSEEQDNIAVESPEVGNTNIPVLFAEASDQERVPTDGVVLDSFFVAVEEEYSVQQQNLHEHERQLLLDYKAKEGRSGEGRDDGDGYEKAVPRHGDTWFHKFISVIRENPGQILRYSHDTRHQPLFLSRPPSKLPATCRHCRGKLQFEFQLLPTLVSKLKFGQAEDRRRTASNESALEFGTVIVFTCKNSCWDADRDVVREEYVYVQAETM